MYNVERNIMTAKVRHFLRIKCHSLGHFLWL